MKNCKTQLQHARAILPSPPFLSSPPPLLTYSELEVPGMRSMIRVVGRHSLSSTSARPPPVCPSERQPSGLCFVCVVFILYLMLETHERRLSELDWKR